MVSGLLIALACKEPFDQDPVPATSASNYAANFIFGNAASVDVDFYANNVKTAEATPVGGGQTAYTHAAIPSNGGFSTGNFNIRAKSTAGNFGAPLNTADVIFRASNTNTNNFNAVDSAYYTILALDTVNRPAPLRTYNATTNFADATLFDPLAASADVQQIAVSDTVGGGYTAYQRSRMILIGTVPLGSSDPGGPRFLVITDQLPLPSATRLPKPAAGKCAVRFVNGCGDGISESLTFVTPASTLNSTYPFANSAFNPSVGSRSLASLAFTTINSGTTDIVAKYAGNPVATLTAADLADGGVYTFFTTGSVRKGTVAIGFVKNK